MKTFWAKLWLAMLAVILPVILVGALFGWKRSLSELNTPIFISYLVITGETLLACLIPIFGGLAFFAGYNLARNASVKSDLVTKPSNPASPITAQEEAQLMKKLQALLKSHPASLSTLVQKKPDSASDKAIRDQVV